MNGEASNRIQNEPSGEMIGVHGEDELGDRKESFPDLNGSFPDLNDLEEERFSSERRDAKYPADCYSFISLHSPFERPTFFAFGVLVWSFQMAFLFLMVLRVAGGKKLSENDDTDNPADGFFSSFIPSNVSSLSRMTQFLALLSYCVFADESLKDIVKAVETFPNFGKAKEGDKIGSMVFSCFLRFTQGTLATIVVLLLVIQTQDVIDIILNFTAVNFISGFDEIAFELAQWGKYGPAFKAEANRIENLTVPDCIYRKYDHVRYRCTILPTALVLIVLASSIAIGQDSDSVWLTQRLRVQFQDGSVFEDYSGCYELDRNTASRMRKRENYVGFDANSQSARFGYCHYNRKWVLYEGNSTDACEIPEEDKIAYSTKTLNFDISMAFEELWYSASGKPLQLYFFEEDDSLTEGQCSSFLGDGICNSYFNLPEYEYDEGDCCASTCSDTLCGAGTLTKVFDTDIVSGNGFPTCKDPVMKPVTIRLNKVFSAAAVMNTGVERETKEPLMILDCDGENVLMVSINDKMVNKAETVMVADGANCIMMVKNSTIGDSGIWYADYSVFHGDKDSIESDPILITNGNSFLESVIYFQKIEDCYLTKLGEYIDRPTVYTGTDPSNKAIRWLMKDSKYSSCERSDILERFALAAINFAAPVEDEAFDQGLWITSGRHCIWRAVGCTGSVVTELNYNAIGAGNYSGYVASEIGLLKNLTAIDFDFLNITGSIPTEIGQLNALTNLLLSINNLSGQIPTEIAGLTDLRSLVLSENFLTGPIPTEIGKLTSLTSLALYENELTGSIPSEIAELPLLKNMILDGNYLNGTIPSSIGKMSSLNYFGLSYNTISGQIPSELGNVETLEHIVFDVNNLVGSVPAEVLNKNLVSISVYGNELSDLIPVDGNVICTAPEGNQGDHYCDCKNHCVKDPMEPDRCACNDAQECCSEFLSQFEECTICDGSLEDPNKYIPEMQATCFHFARFVSKNIQEFGTVESCRGVASYAESLGCRCNGRVPFEKCNVCEFGLENPDLYVEVINATCKEAKVYIHEDVTNFGTESLCNKARVDVAAFGCKCKEDSSELKNDELGSKEDGLDHGLDKYTECIVCEFGLENPDFFVDEYQTLCQDYTAMIQENIEVYGTVPVCNTTRIELAESGCVCKTGDSDLEETSKTFGV